MTSLDLPSLYGITDPGLMPGKLLFSKVEIALKAGLRLLQYRNKSANHSQRTMEARELQALCKNYSATFIVNDDVKLAAQLNADGVHLGKNDSSIRAARALLGNHALIGATCHNNLKLASQALENGASYVAFGRFFDSETKSSASAADLSILTIARKQLCCPIVAIGGIKTNNAKSVWQSGAHCLAVCHELFSVAEPNQIVAKFSELFQEQI